jgi:tetratricopeptide (TPR) repeat protein
MADHSRIDDLRRRVQKDPASIAFAQLAEEFRRAGQFQEAVDVCRAGLEIHPGYLSAHVTLGRAFLELNQLDDAQRELELVLKTARENLAAIRGLAEIHHRRGDLGEALTQYRAALALARNDPELQQTVSELSRKIEPPKPAHSAGGLSFEQAREELSFHAPIAEPQAIVPALVEHETISEPIAEPEVIALPPAPAPSTPFASAPFMPPAAALAVPEAVAPVTQWTAESVFPSAAAPAFVPVETPLSLPSQPESIVNDSTRARAARTIVALELWLGAIHVARAHRRA